MVGKRGWLRIVEASLAILIIFGVLLIVNRTSPFASDVDLTTMTTPLLEEIARNVTFRDQIITEGKQAEPAIRQFVGSRITQSTIKFDVAVCEVEEICSMSAYPQDASEIYAGERIVSATLTEYSPKKVKIFLWRTTA